MQPTTQASPSLQLTGSDSSFSVDPNTGLITIKGDFETKTSYKFNVVATDPSGNSSIKFKVNIADVKDIGDEIELTNQRDFYNEHRKSF